LRPPCAASPAASCPFAVFRFASGFGIGGEWAAGTPLLQESVPETMRVRLAGWLHTATPSGILLASVAAFLIPVIGWRGLFLLGALPALLTIYLRLRLPESAAWQQSRKTAPRTRPAVCSKAHPQKRRGRQP
jgi:MFS family permease